MTSLITDSTFLTQIIALLRAKIGIFAVSYTPSCILMVVVVLCG
jgi:hypothetical protein